MLQGQRSQPHLSAGSFGPIRAIAFLAKAAETMRVDQARLAMDPRAYLSPEACDRIVGSLGETVALLRPLTGEIDVGEATVGAAVINEVQQFAHAAAVELALWLETREPRHLAALRSALRTACAAAALVRERAHRFGG